MNTQSSGMTKPAIAVFTVKRFIKSQGTYWTYGGFGDWVRTLLPHFERVRLVCHVKPGPVPEGWYELSDERLEFVHLPWTGSEAIVLATVPIVFARGWSAVRDMDLVSARMPDYTGVIGNVIARLRGKRIVNHVIADWALQAQVLSWKKKYGLGALLKIHLRLYDLMERLACRGQLTFTHGQSCYLKHRGFCEAIEVFASAHHLQDIVTEFRPRFARSDCFRILTVARLDSVKNHDVILRALTGMDSRWQAVFVGSGPQETQLRQRCMKLGLSERVRFAGPARRGDELWRYYDDADVFALASRSEGTPKVLLEAMARGLPVVATHVGGIPSIVKDRETGLLFSDDDPTSLSQALYSMAVDAEMRTRVVQGGARLARSTTVESQVQSVVATMCSQWPELWKSSGNLTHTGDLEGQA